jgi:acetyltransferase-like isoleucine patch superfamily enzyme
MTTLRQICKPWLRAAGNRLRFPRVHAGSCTYISPGCRLDPGVTMGRACRIFTAYLGPETSLGDCVIIGHGSRVSRARLGHGCLVEQQGELYDCALADYVAVQTRCVLTGVRVGRYSYIAREAYLNDVAIGSFASIGPRTLLGFGSHPVNLPATAPVFFSTRRQCGASFTTADYGVEREPIVIGHDVWLGAHVFVCDGVSIGAGAVVAAGAVVTRDVPPYAIVGGVAAKLIRYRFTPEVIGRLLALQWWDWPEPRLRAMQPWFAQPDINAFLRHAET